MKIYYHFFFFIFALFAKFYRRLYVHVSLMNGEVSRKETGTKFQARSNSSVAVLQADKSLLKIKRAVLSRHLKLFEGNFDSTEMKGNPRATRFPFAWPFYIPDRTFLARMERKNVS